MDIKKCSIELMTALALASVGVSGLTTVFQQESRQVQATRKSKKHTKKTKKAKAKKSTKKKKAKLAISKYYKTNKVVNEDPKHSDKDWGGDRLYVPAKETDNNIGNVEYRFEVSHLDKKTEENIKNANADLLKALEAKNNDLNSNLAVEYLNQAKNSIQQIDSSSPYYGVALVKKMLDRLEKCIETPNFDNLLNAFIAVNSAYWHISSAVDVKDDSSEVPKWADAINDWSSVESSRYGDADENDNALTDLVSKAAPKIKVRGDKPKKLYKNPLKRPLTYDDKQVAKYLSIQNKHFGLEGYGTYLQKVNEYYGSDNNWGGDGVNESKSPFLNDILNGKYVFNSIPGKGNISAKALKRAEAKSDSAHRRFDKEAYKRQKKLAKYLGIYLGNQGLDYSCIALDSMQY